eukprot:jgi/Botrbrau1/11832/Bobra.0224s0027.2
MKNGIEELETTGGTQGGYERGGSVAPSAFRAHSTLGRPWNSLSRSYRVWTPRTLKDKPAAARLSVHSSGIGRGHAPPLFIAAPAKFLCTATATTFLRRVVRC